MAHYSCVIRKAQFLFQHIVVSHNLTFQLHASATFILHRLSRPIAIQAKFLTIIVTLGICTIKSLTKNILDCDQCNELFARIIFSRGRSSVGRLVFNITLTLHTPLRYVPIVIITRFLVQCLALVASEVTKNFGVTVLYN